jgi:hypothetical protein
MSVTQLISVEYLKNNSDLAHNIEDRILVPNILKAQRIDLQEILGSGLYNTIIAYSALTAMSAAEQTLITDFVAPFLVEATIYNAIPSIYAKLENSSVVTKTTEAGTPVGLSEIQWRRDLLKNAADFLGQRIVTHICNNIASFPTYYSTSQTDVLPMANAFTSPVYVGKSRSCDIINILRQG